MIHLIAFGGFALSLLAIVIATHRATKRLPTGCKAVSRQHRHAA